MIRIGSRIGVRVTIPIGVAWAPGVGGENSRPKTIIRFLGARPLNLSRKPGEALRLALVDQAGVWSEGAPHIEVALEWA